MQAKKIIGKGTGGERKQLVDILPLDTPLGVFIFPVHACNFKCKYCHFSVPRDKRKINYENGILDLKLLKKCVDDLKEFNKKVKVVKFVGLGEPLLHNDIDKMVKYIVESDVADATEIVTNGSLLTHDVSDRLIESGLSRLSISVQGLDAEMYEKTSQVKIDFDKFFEQIRYFYDNKKNTEVYIKILNCSLRKDEEELYFNMFGDVCDYITIENVEPLFSEVNYSNIPTEDRKSVRGELIENNDICSYPFYMMQINPNGDVVPCCSCENIDPLGNANEESLIEIWNGNRYNSFRKKMLLGCSKMDEGIICRTCKAYKYSRFKEDLIDEINAKRLYGLY